MEQSYNWTPIKKINLKQYKHPQNLNPYTAKTRRNRIKKNPKAAIDSLIQSFGYDCKLAAVLIDREIRHCNLICAPKSTKSTKFKEFF